MTAGQESSYFKADDTS